MGEGVCCAGCFWSSEFLVAALIVADGIRAAVLLTGEGVLLAGAGAFLIGVGVLLAGAGTEAILIGAGVLLGSGDLALFLLRYSRGFTTGFSFIGGGVAY